MTITLEVRGMTCQHCVRAVTQALQAVAGAGDVTVDLEGKRARVKGGADPQALVRAVVDEGYEASVLEAR